MTDRIHFTKQRVEKLPPAPAGKRTYHYDDRINGLLVQVTPTGRKSFQVYRKVKGRIHRVTLGTFPDMTIEQARRVGQSCLAELAEGRDINAEKKVARAKQITLAEVFEDYLRVRKGLKESSVYDYRRVMREGFKDWQNRPMRTITRDLVERHHDKLGKTSKARANLSMRLLRALFNFAAEEYENHQGEAIFTDNPVKRLSRNKSWYRIETRKRSIHPYQLQPWFKALSEIVSERDATQTPCDYLVLVLMTGLRRNEAANLEWDDVDLRGKTLTIPDPKNREPHTLPLSDYLYDLLERRSHAGGRYVFPGRYDKGALKNPYHVIAEVVRLSGVKFSVHDLRRSFISIAEGLDIPAYALKRLANHKMSTDVTAGYIVSDVERLRKPMQQITDFILKSAEIKKTAEVIPISKAK